MSTCTADGCTAPHAARGLCAPHYNAARRSGALSARPALTLAERFWAKVNKNGPVPSHRPELGPCWMWTGAHKPDGYGQIHYLGKTTKAPRVAWLLERGDIPPETPNVLHHCDNPPCVRPGHLFLGTLADNAQDMVAKGRGRLQQPGAHHYGLDNVRGKLTDLDVAAIRALRGHRSSSALAAAFDVSAAHIRLLWRGTQRVHVAPAPLATAMRHLTERTAA